jgi:hypothetical protein
MDVSPIQRLAATASGAVRPPVATQKVAGSAPVAQARAAAADSEAARTKAETPSTRVLVSWRPSSLGYVTRVVDQTSGSVLFQSPPEQVLAMVEKLIRRLEGDAA